MSRLAMYFVVIFIAANFVLAQPQRAVVPGKPALSNQRRDPEYGPGMIKSQFARKPIRAAGAARQQAALPTALTSQIFPSPGVYPSAAASQTGFAVAVGDFNGDGILDVALANFCSDNTCAQGSVTVFQGNGDGTFTPGGTFLTGAQYSTAIVTADLNGDGKLDLIVANECQINSGCADSNGIVSVLWGKGDGTFQQPAATYNSQGSIAWGLALADFDGNGTLDVAVVNQQGQVCCDGTVAILFSDGRGTLTVGPAYDSGGMNPTFVSAADVNGDGRPDAVVVNTSQSASNLTGQLGVLLNTSGGILSPVKSYPTGGQSATSLVLGDFNHDGHVDAALIDLCPSGGCASGTNNESIALMQGNGDGSFGAPILYSNQDGLSNLAVADLNADGNADLVVINRSESFAEVWLGNGDFTFQTPVRYASGDFGPVRVIIADFNQDGKSDLAIANGNWEATNGNGSVSLLLGNGDGSFRAAYSYLSSFSHGVSAADFNRDGKMDLAVPLCADITCAQGAVNVMLANASGFQTVRYLTTTGPSIFAATGDFNGDGILDLAVSGCADSACTTGAVSILLGNADGTFQSAVNYASGGVQADKLQVADLNGDGKLDLIVANFCGTSACTGNGSVGVLLGNGNGTFQAAVSYDTGGLNTSDIVLADFNGDGKLDAALMNECADSNCNSGTVALLLGNGDGTFKSSTIIPLGTYFPVALTAADFNGDGKMDLAGVSLCADSTCSGDGVVSVLLGNGDGTFRAAASYDAGDIDSESVVLGDFNGDGISDLVIPGTFSTGILLGNADGSFQPAEVCYPGGFRGVAADFNGDGRVDLALLSGMGNTIVIFPNIVTPVQAQTSTVISASPNPSAYNQAVTLTATITSAAHGTPSGTVTFTNGAATLGSMPVTNGAASLTTTGLPIGVNSISASYSGDTKFQPSDSTSLAQTVNSAPSFCTLSFTPTSLVAYQPVTFSTEIVPQFGGTTTGTVSLLDNGLLIAGASPLSASAVTQSVQLIAGSHNLTAEYSGDSNVNSSLCSTSAIVSKAVTTTTLTSPGTSTYQQPVILTATVSPQFPGAPSGNVNFFDGTAILGTAPLVGGSATFTTTSLSVGSHTITASYIGDQNFTGSSAVAGQVVSQAATATVIVSWANPSAVGEVTTLSIRIAGAFGGTPTGKVTLQDGATILGKFSPSLTGSVSFKTSTLALGTHNITAQYSGDASFLSSSGSLTQTVVSSLSTTTLTSTATASPLGASLTFNVAVSSSGGVPTGTVILSDGTNALANLTLGATGSASFTTSTLLVGRHALTAVYSGDQSFSSSSAALAQTITKAAAMVTLTPSSSSYTFGANVTFTVTVGPITDGFTPTGSVTLKDGSSVLASSLPLDPGGNASFTTGNLLPGTHRISAVYGGDANFTTRSVGVAVDVLRVPTTMFAILTETGPFQFGHTVPFLVNLVYTEVGGFVPTGTVDLKDGTNIISSVPAIDASSFVFTVSTFSLGMHKIVVSYPGDSIYAPSSQSLTLEITKDVTDIRLSNPCQGCYFGEMLTFQVHVGGLDPSTGNVVIRDGSTVLANLTLDPFGGASLTVPYLNAGTHNFSATYPGDPTHFGSQVTTVVVVSRATANPVLTSAPNPSSSGQTVAFSVTFPPIVLLNPVPLPTGKVLVLDGTTTLATLTLDKTASATFTTSKLSAGSHSIVAEYQGDNNYNAADSLPPLIQVVN